MIELIGDIIGSGFTFNLFFTLIQVLLTGFLALFSLGLVLVTISYAISTKRMANAILAQNEMQFKEFKLRNEPKVECTVRQTSKDVNNPTILIFVQNVGFHPVKLKGISYIMRENLNPDNYHCNTIKDLPQWLDKSGPPFRNERHYRFKDIGIDDPKGLVNMVFKFHFVDMYNNNFQIDKQIVII